MSSISWRQWLGVPSGYVRAEGALRAEQIGVRDVVLKPNTGAEIGQLIRDRLDALKKLPWSIKHGRLVRS